MLKFWLNFLPCYQRNTKCHLFCLSIRNQPEEQTTIWYHQSLVQSHSISKWRFSLVAAQSVPLKPILRVGSSSHMGDFTAQRLAHRSAYNAFMADGFLARTAGRLGDPERETKGKISLFNPLMIDNQVFDFFNPLQIVISRNFVNVFVWTTRKLHLIFR